jgi:prolipoprotein diacylglyceryltransferase
MASWGNWFSQEVYGRPAGVPWAVEIAPMHRVPGYENFATFQPLFLYESVWDVLAGVLVILAARRFQLTGARTFACYAALQATGSVCTGMLRIGRMERLAGIAVSQILLALVLVGAVGYLYLTRARKGPDVVEPAAGDAPGIGAAVAAGAPGGSVPAAGGVSAAGGVPSGDADRRAGSGPGGAASPSFH